jgi:hypothetical protein
MVVAAVTFLVVRLEAPAGSDWAGQRGPAFAVSAGPGRHRRCGTLTSGVSMICITRAGVGEDPMRPILCQRGCVTMLAAPALLAFHLVFPT